MQSRVGGVVTRRVSTDELKAANTVMRQPHELGAWDVCDGYEIRDGAIVASHDHRDAAGRHRWRTYRPLDDTPDLFLKLALMHKAPNFELAALDFSHKYGMLLHAWTPRGRKTGKTDLSWWHEEATRAWVILKLYEAALNRDGETVRCLHAKYDNSVLQEGFDLLEDGKHFEGDVQAAQIGFVESALMVEHTVGLLCRPSLVIGLGGDFRAPMMWRFKNLLGAMYLQMFWLIASGGDLGRCEACDRTFFLTRTNPEGRKRRRDKRFCNAACRQAHHRGKKKG